MSETEEACAAYLVVDGETGKAGGLDKDGDVNDDADAHLSKIPGEDQVVLEAFSEEIIGDKNDTGNVSNNAISDASLEQCVKEIDPESSTFADGENLHTEAKSADEVASPCNNKNLDEQKCSHIIDTSVENNCEADAGFKEIGVLLTEEECVQVKRPETGNVCETTVEDHQSQLQVEIQEDNSDNGCSTDMSGDKEDTCIEVNTVSPACHNEEENDDFDKMQCEGGQNPSTEAETDSGVSSGAQSKNKCIVEDSSVPLPEDVCTKSVCPSIKKTQIEDTRCESKESTSVMDISRSTLLESENKPETVENEQTTENSCDPKPVISGKPSRDKDELTPVDRATKVSKEPGSGGNENRSDMPTTRFDVKTSISPTKVPQNLSLKSPAARETRGSTKQR